MRKERDTEHKVKIKVEDEAVEETVEESSQEEKQEKHGKSHKADKHKADKKDKKEEQAAETEEQPRVDESYLRLQADFNNYRKRVLREKEDLYKRANEDIITELLPVLDHLELALAAAEDRKDDPFVEGFRMVGEQLKAALAKFGVTEVESEGVEFDPNVHEAIVHMPTDDVEENHVVSVTRKGYRLGERLLRAAQVAVSSGSPNEQ